jgi:hypothetical protein
MESIPGKAIRITFLLIVITARSRPTDGVASAHLCHGNPSFSQDVLLGRMPGSVRA